MKADTETGRYGDTGKGRHGDTGTRRPGDRANSFFSLSPLHPFSVSPYLPVSVSPLILHPSSLRLHPSENTWCTASTFQSERYIVTTSAPAARNSTSDTVFVTPRVCIPAARPD